MVPEPRASPTVRSVAEPPADLSAQAAGLFKASGYPQLAKLKCRVSRQTVKLCGQVASFYLKQMAQTLVLQLDSVRELRNCVEVVG